MGDRGNIAIQYDGKKSKRVYFYTHWRGSAMLEIVASALERGKNRWGDDAYLARVIFCELVGDDTDGIAGYGIGPEPGDNEHPFVVVDMASQTVFREADERKGFDYISRPLKSATDPLGFIDYISKHKPQPVPA